MRIKPFPSLVLLLFFFGQSVHANTFIVTSNADSGPGTLREAITLANSNGIIIHDTIIFSIPNTTEAGRTINLQTELPSLSSKIIIDGSSQPGTAIDISDAKIILFLDHYTQLPFTYLFIQNAAEVSILGLCFRYFDEPAYGGGEHYAIGLRNSSDVQIGKPGKGNLFSSVRLAITNGYWNYYTDSVRNVVIQSNVVGLRAAGMFWGGGLVDLRQARNIQIGGSRPEEGNIFLNAVIIGQSAFPNPDFFVIMENNKFNFDGTRYYQKETYVDLGGNAVDDTTVFRTFIKDNFFNGDNSLHALLLTTINHKVKIQGNKFGTDATGTVCHGVRNNIQTIWCQYVLIGGYAAEEQNLIAADIYVGSDKVHVVQNKFSGKIDNKVYVPDDPFIKIITYDNNLITGQANPNAIIQLYENKCMGPPCIRTNYLTSVVADANGNWQFPYTAAMPNIIATATRSDSSTSEFTEPKVDHYTNRVIKNATCGKSNGSITGIKIFEGTHIQWINANTRQVISTDTNLVNVPAGNYDLSVYNGLNGCPFTVNFTISDAILPGDLNPQPYITDASCGQSNGSIITSSFGYGSKWMNANYDSVGSGYYINNALPGIYYLKLWIDYDTSCNKTYGPFTIKNNSGPTLNINNVQITPSTCDEANGSIKNINTRNVTGTPFIQWRDSLNNPVGTTLNLLNIKAGKYKLLFKDQGSCDTIIAPFFLIPNNGTITIDKSHLLITASGCTIRNGSIRNIGVSGVTTWQWQNLTTNTNAGNSIDLTGLSAGDYQLTASNAFGCSLSSSVITVPQGQFASIIPQNVTVSNGSCGENNGSIKLEGFSNQAALLSYYWINSSTSQIAGTELNLTGLGAGTYEFVATDTNGCKQTIFTQSIIVNPKPVFNTGAAVLTDDQCSLQKGSVTGIKTIGLQGPTAYTWTNANNLVVGNSPDLSNIGTGDYRLTVNDQDNCIIQSGLFIIKNHDNAGIAPLYDEMMIQRNTAANLIVKNFRNGTYVLYNDAAGTQILQQNTTGLFTTAILNDDKDFYVQHIDGSCRSPLVKIKITVVDISVFAIPTAFTPNQDGLNDRLTLKVIGYINVEYFRIYNRNGELVFSTSTVNNGWDGTLKGIKQPAGAYVWMAKGRDITGKTITDKGSLVLIR